MFYAIGFALSAFGAGNIFQANQVALHVIDITGGTDSFFANKAWLIGVFLAIPAALVILGGISAIAQWTSRMVPLMSVIYAVGVLAVLGANFTDIPHAASLIVSGAFNPDSISGGVIGVMIIGIQRALFSNVAGVGTAGLAHSVTKNRRPAEEGFTAGEPFFDSVVVCTLTALSIIVTGQYLNQGEEGVTLASNNALPRLMVCSLATFLVHHPLCLLHSLVLLLLWRKGSGYVFKEKQDRRIGIQGRLLVDDHRWRSSIAGYCGAFL